MSKISKQQNFVESVVRQALLRCPPGPEEPNKPHAQAPAETPETKPLAVTGAGSHDFEALVASVTEQVLRFINGNK
ncbi:MAG: hypothetical protein P8Z30_04975 [Acidobacteriota bacterium]